MDTIDLILIYQEQKDNLKIIWLWPHHNLALFLSIFQILLTLVLIYLTSNIIIRVIVSSILSLNDEVLPPWHGQEKEDGDDNGDQEDLHLLLGTLSHNTKVDNLYHSLLLCFLGV